MSSTASSNNSLLKVFIITHKRFELRVRDVTQTLLLLPATLGNVISTSDTSPTPSSTPFPHPASASFWRPYLLNQFEYKVEIQTVAARGRHLSPDRRSSVHPARFPFYVTNYTHPTTHPFLLHPYSQMSNSNDHPHFPFDPSFLSTPARRPKVRLFFGSAWYCYC